MALDIDGSALRSVVETGFMGISRGLFAESDAVFTGVRAVRPDLEAGYIGAALVSMLGNDMPKAVAILREGAQTEAVMAFLVIALARMGDKQQAREVIEDMQAAGSNPNLLAFAQDALAT